MTDTRTVENIINSRRVILGPSDKLRAVWPLKYPWTQGIKERMIANTWFPNEIDMSADSRDYKQLRERVSYDRALAFLSNLDSFQLTNLADNISVHVTAPEIKSCLHRQVWEEEVHVDSYSLMVESTSEDPLSIYDMYRHNPLLQAKNEFVTAQADQIGEEFSVKGFIKAVVSNCVLEGIYFFSGFLTFYAIGRGTQRMLGSVDMIRYIQRDELTHLDLFVYIWYALREEFPEAFDEQLIQECLDIIAGGVQRESMWGHHVIEDGVLGLTNPIVDGFLQHRGDEICDALSLPRLYDVTNPVPWFYSFSEVNQGESNFFEAKPIDYQKGGLEW